MEGDRQGDARQDRKGNLVMGYIPNRFANSRCRQCRKANTMGESVYYVRNVRGVLCVACQEGKRETPSPTPTPTPTPSVPSTAGRKAGKVSRTNGRDIERFETWGSFVECAESRRNREGASSNASFSGKEGEKFSMTRSWDDALKLAKQGWVGIRPEVDALVEQIDKVVAPALQPAFQSYFDVSGGTVDIGRFLDGEPECMVETKLVTIAKPGRVIGILVNASFAGFTRAEDIRKRGVAIVALIDTLEKLQHSTEVWVEVSIREGATTGVKVKGADETLDIDALMFAVAHPAMLRRMYFAYLEGHPKAQYRALTGSGFKSYGGSNEKLVMAEELQCSVALNGMLKLDADKWICEQLASFGLVKEGE